VSIGVRARAPSFTVSPFHQALRRPLEPLHEPRLSCLQRTRRATWPHERALEDDREVGAGWRARAARPMLPDSATRAIAARARLMAGRA
jgi:hypothetical protein